MASVVACSKCYRPVEPHNLNLDHAIDCGTCGSELRALVFPALFHRPAAGPVELIGAETEASCFYHAENRAAVACDSCGRFICGLCRIDMSGRSVCPSCMESGIQTQKLAGFESRRTMYDTIALALAVVPLLLIWPTLLTAPAAIYIAVRYWRAPSSIVRRSKVRFVLAIVIALAQIVLWIMIGVLLLARWPRP
jgi:hypothetical protein